MNNPFDRNGMSGMVGSNNPFDNDPTSARNRFPDISSASPYGALPASPPPGQYPGQVQGQYGQFGTPAAGGYNQWNQQAHQPNQNLNPNLQQQQQQQYGQFGTPGQGASPSMFSGFGSNPQSPYGAPTGMGVQGYNPMGSTPYGTPGFGTGSFSGSSAGGGYMDAQRYGMSGNTPQNTSTNPALNHFDPLSSSSGGSYQSMMSPGGQQRQSAFGAGAGAHGVGPMGMGMGVGVSTNPGNSFQLKLDQPAIDPGPLVWHPRNPADPNSQAITGFANQPNQTTIHVPVRSHMFSQYSAKDHPKTVIAQHRAELEQWDQYGWRQSLNSLENLRIAWEAVLTDVGRVSDAGYPAVENAIVLKMKREVTEKIDNVTAAYLQMQEVYSSYRQSQDVSSRNRVRECLNAGLKSLPDWP